MGQLPSVARRLKRDLIIRRRLNAHRRNGAWIAADSADIDAASTLAPGTRVAHHAALRDSHLGRYSTVGRFSKLAFATVGPFCSISWDCTIGAVMHPLDHASSHAFPYAPEAGGFVTDRLQHVEPLTLGADVWVGANAVIMPGVNLGDGCVVAASAVVRQDVEPYAIVGGVPAKVIGQRFPDEIAARLQALAWWDWPFDKLEAAVPLFRRQLTPDVLDRLAEAAQ